MSRRREKKSTATRPPMVYAALLATRAGAADGVKRLLAQAAGDHGATPPGLVFRIHSDKGSELLTKDLGTWLMNQRINHTTAHGVWPCGKRGRRKRHRGHGQVRSTPPRRSTPRHFLVGSGGARGGVVQQSSCLDLPFPGRAFWHSRNGGTRPTATQCMAPPSLAWHSVWPVRPGSWSPQRLSRRTSSRGHELQNL